MKFVKHYNVEWFNICSTLVNVKDLSSMYMKQNWKYKNENTWQSTNILAS